MGSSKIDAFFFSEKVSFYFLRKQLFLFLMIFQIFMRKKKRIFFFRSRFASKKNDTTLQKISALFSDGGREFSHSKRSGGEVPPPTKTASQKCCVYIMRARYVFWRFRVKWKKYKKAVAMDLTHWQKCTAVDGPILFRTFHQSRTGTSQTRHGHAHLPEN